MVLAKHFYPLQHKRFLSPLKKSSKYKFNNIPLALPLKHILKYLILRDRLRTSALTNFLSHARQLSGSSSNLNAKFLYQNHKSGTTTFSESHSSTSQGLVHLTSNCGPKSVKTFLSAGCCKSLAYKPNVNQQIIVNDI